MSRAILRQAFMKRQIWAVIPKTHTSLAVPAVMHTRGSCVPSSRGPGAPWSCFKYAGIETCPGFYCMLQKQEDISLWKQKVGVRPTRCPRKGKAWTVLESLLLGLLCTYIIPTIGLSWPHQYSGHDESLVGHRVWGTLVQRGGVHG